MIHAEDTKRFKIVWLIRGLEGGLEGTLEGRRIEKIQNCLPHIWAGGRVEGMAEWNAGGKDGVGIEVR